jgi:mono/diheme cytochrome c family protein
MSMPKSFSWPQRLRDTEIVLLRSSRPTRSAGVACRTAQWRAAAVVVALTVFGGVTSAQTPKLGTPIAPADIAPWDISILPDGTGLPPGSGTAAQGSQIYAEKCAVCHGEQGKGGLAAALVGGDPVSAGIDATKTIANFWPYATTLFDFTRRAMPWPRPRTLTNDEVYALTAYMLGLNHIIKDDEVMNAQTLPKVRMPNRDGFIVRWPNLMP